MIQDIEKQNETVKINDKEIDYGFKHYTLQEPYQNTLDKCESFEKNALLTDQTILDGFGKDTVLTTWANYDGYGLTPAIQPIDLQGYTAYLCDKHLYLIAPNFTEDCLVALVEKYNESDFNPENLILFGYSFNEWSISEMLEKNLKVFNDGEKNLKINISVRY